MVAIAEAGIAHLPGCAAFVYAARADGRGAGRSGWGWMARAGGLRRRP
jgi:hypothetical protein